MGFCDVGLLFDKMVGLDQRGSVDHYTGVCVALLMVCVCVCVPLLWLGCG